MPFVLFKTVYVRLELYIYESVRFLHVYICRFVRVWVLLRGGVSQLTSAKMNVFMRHFHANYSNKIHLLSISYMQYLDLDIEKINFI